MQLSIHSYLYPSIILERAYTYILSYSRWCRNSPMVSHRDDGFPPNCKTKSWSLNIVSSTLASDDALMSHNPASFPLVSSRAHQSSRRMRLKHYQPTILFKEKKPIFINCHHGMDPTHLLFQRRVEKRRKFAMEAKIFSWQNLFYQSQLVSDANSSTQPFLPSYLAIELAWS